MIYRQTVQKYLILKAMDVLCHATADAVYENVSKKHPAVSKGTVYRNLNFLVEQGQISRIKIPDGPDCFDKTVAHHYHVRCCICGKIQDVDVPYMERLNKMPVSDGFQIKGHTLIFDGSCSDCQLQDKG